MAACLLAAIGCAHAPATAPARPGRPPDPGPIRPPSALPYDFQWRQRVTAHWPSGKQGFDAVLQKRGGKLTLLGLSPMGTPGFVLELGADAAVHVDNRTGRPLPFAPEFILADVERVFFPWLPTPPPGFTGERRGQVLGVSVVEHYAGGQLTQRSFYRGRAPQRQAVHVYYRGFRPGADAPAHVRVQNGWFRYTLEIATLEQTRLPPKSE